MIKSGKGRKVKTHKLPINGKCALVIEEYDNNSRWSIVDRETNRTLIRFERHVHSVLIRRGNEWQATHSGKHKREIDHSAFSNALEALALFFHEVGHHRHGIAWKKKPTLKEELLDERRAWAFSLKEIRKISRVIGVPLIDKKNKKGLLKNIHGCIKTYEA